MPSALPLESRRPARGHEPVLADEVARMLALRPGETVVDCTFGAGGHARRLAPALGEGGRYIAIDQDPEAGDWFADLADDVVCETRFIRANFADALPRLVDQGLRADAVLMDLRSFSPGNQGCRYELKELLDLVDLERVTLLVDGTTDRPYLEETLHVLWQRVELASPNRRVASPTVHLYDTEGQSAVVKDLLKRLLVARGSADEQDYASPTPQVSS